VVPPDIPTSCPVAALTLAIAGLLVLHVPSGVALLTVIVVLGHIVAMPEIADGGDVTVIGCTA
jgi:hypothetical protein